MGFIFILLVILSGFWYSAFYEILLHIERTHYRRNWEKDTKDISWLPRSRFFISYRSRRAYTNLARSWLLSTPAWARDHKMAHRLIWCWRMGHVLLTLAILGLLLGPLVRDVLR